MHQKKCYLTKDAVQPVMVLYFDTKNTYFKYNQLDSAYLRDGLIVLPTDLWMKSRYEAFPVLIV